MRAIDDGTHVHAVHATIPGPYSGTGSPTPPPDPSRRGRHVLKSQPEGFQRIWAGQQRHDVRRNDRDMREGDSILYREWVPEPVAAQRDADEDRNADLVGYTGREVLVHVGAVTTSARLVDVLQPGAIAFDFEKVAQTADASLSRTVSP